MSQVKNKSLHKVTFDIAKELKTIANQLPPLTQKTAHTGYVVPGSVLTNKVGKDGLPLKDKNGSHLNEKSSYILSQEVTKPLDHYRELRKMYALYGKTGIEEYLKMVKGVVDKEEEEENKAQAKIKKTQE